VTYVLCAVGCPALTVALLWLLMRAPASAGTPAPALELNELDGVRRELVRLRSPIQPHRGLPVPGEFLPRSQPGEYYE